MSHMMLLLFETSVHDNVAHTASSLTMHVPAQNGTAIASPEQKEAAAKN